MSVRLMTLVWSTTLPTGPKMVLLALADNANDKGECYPSVKTMTEKCSMSERAVQGHLAALEKAGVVARDMRAGRSTFYTISVARVNEIQQPPEEPAPRKSCTPQNLRPTPADSVKTPAESAPAPADPAPITITQPPEPPENHQSLGDDPPKTPLAPTPPPPMPPAPTPPKPAATPEDPPEFVEAWACYPKRAGGSSRKGALKAWNARIKAGADPAAMLAGVKRYAAFCAAMGKVGTAYVKQAATFFGPDDHYLDEFPLPKSKTGYTHNLSGMDYSRGVDDDGRF